MLTSRNIFTWEDSNLTEMLDRFHIPLLHKHVVSKRSKVSVNNKALQFEAASRVRERRHLGIDWCSAQLSFLPLLSAHYGLNRQKIGFPWCSEIPLNGYYAAQNERGDNPRHLFSHLSTHIHITKGASVRGGFICIVWSSLYATGGEREAFDKRNKYLLCGQVFVLFF